MGLVAREIEAAGVATLTMTSAWDITAAVCPPRAAFVHAPLGHQSGSPGNLESQLSIVRAALEAGISIEHPGTIVDLGLNWVGDDGWEQRAYSPEVLSTGPDGRPVRD